MHLKNIWIFYWYYLTNNIETIRKFRSPSHQQCYGMERKIRAITKLQHRQQWKLSGKFKLSSLNVNVSQHDPNHKWYWLPTNIECFQNSNVNLYSPVSSNTRTDTMRYVFQAIYCRPVEICFALISFVCLFCFPFSLLLFVYWYIGNFILAIFGVYAQINIALKEPHTLIGSLFRTIAKNNCTYNPVYQCVCDVALLFKISIGNLVECVH